MSEQDRAPAAVHAEPSRDLGLVSALAIGMGTMIAAGIFTLSGLAVGYVGSAAIVSFLLAAVVAALTALAYCEFTSIYPQSGEGYLYARKTFSPPLAYVVGWCLVLGYTSSCAFYIASLSTYFNEFVWRLPIESLAGLVFLAALTLLNVKGTKESGTFQVVVTGAKIVLLCWFISAGLGHANMTLLIDQFSTDLPAITSTAALVFITFFGFSAIAASAGEVRNPTRTVPVAIFVSMLLVTILYSLVVVVLLVAGLSEYTEAAMGVAARAFLGPVGGMVIVVGALFSMISASNASILACSRVAFAMSRHRHLPIAIGTVNHRTGTPLVAILIVGAAIGSFALLLPLENLAHFADSVLLLALVLVNVALILHRRQYPDIERPFRVPLVPLVPVLAIIANLYLLVQIPLQGHVTPVVMAAVAVVLGIIGFLAWKGNEFGTEAPREQPSKVLVRRASTATRKFRVLVPIANPASMDQLIDLAGAIASARDGEIVLLRVVLVPEQLNPTLEEAHADREERLLATARKRALRYEVPVSSQIRIGREAGRAILEAARQERCTMIVLGWRGATSTTRRIMGEVTDHVVNHAAADILLVRPASDGRALDGLLLPTAGGVHAARAEGYARDMAAATGVPLTLCSVVPDGSDEQVTRQEERLREEAERLSGVPEGGGPAATVGYRLLRDDDIASAIIAGSEEYGAVVIGAAGKSFTMQVLFGAIPEEVVRRSSATVIVVKHHEPARALLGRILTE